MIRRLIRYIEGLEVTQGEGLGGPLRLFPWERRFPSRCLRAGSGKGEFECSEGQREIKKDQKDQRWAFWLFVLMAGIVAVVGGFLGNFLREAAVQIIEGLRVWWVS